MRIPNNPKDLDVDTQDGKNEWRPGQRETVQRVVDAFQDGYRFVLLNAPTGSGKTIVATAVCNALGVSSLSLTHTLQLQSQYQKTFPKATLATGRGNHQCKLKDYKTAEGAPCQDGEQCRFMHTDVCSYYQMLYDADERNQVIANYAYAVRLLQVSGMKVLENRNPVRKQLLVCDEGDLVEGAIVEAAKEIIYRPPLHNDGLYTPPSPKLEAWKEWTDEHHNTVKWEAEEARRNLDELSKGEGELTGEERAGEEIKRARLNARKWQSRLRLLQTIATMKEEEWFLENEGNDRVIMRPLWGWVVAKKMLWGQFSRCLFMSATLPPKDILCTTLGMPEEQAIYIDVPSTFPPENRPVFYWPVAKMSMKAGEEEWEAMIAGIQRIANQDLLREKKGIVHSGSFKVAQRLYQGLRDDPRFITHKPGQSRDEALREFKESTEPLVLITPSFTTGLDLPGVIGWQVISKVPFGNLGDPVVKLRREFRTNGRDFGKLNYDAEAMNTVVQACGRAVRSAEDQGVTYILDKNFIGLYKRTHSPQHFKEAFHWKR